MIKWITGSQHYWRMLLILLYTVGPVHLRECFSKGISNNLRNFNREGNIILLLKGIHITNTGIPKNTSNTPVWDWKNGAFGDKIISLLQLSTEETLYQEATKFPSTRENTSSYLKNLQQHFIFFRSVRGFPHSAFCHQTMDFSRDSRI